MSAEKDYEDVDERDGGQLPASWRWDPSRPREAEDEPVAQPCPPWCGDRAGHPYTWGQPGDVHSREHMRWFGNDVVVSAYYEAVVKDGPELAREPLSVRMPAGQPDALTAQEARALGLSLLAATDGLQHLTVHCVEGR